MPAGRLLWVGWSTPNVFPFEEKVFPLDSASVAPPKSQAEVFNALF
jgi:hypothetical protein